MKKIECKKCGGGLRDFNVAPYTQISYCPRCGARVSKAQEEALYNEVTLCEITEMIKEHLLDYLLNSDCGEDDIGEIADRAWENENCNGAVFCSNYEADRFAARHAEWVHDAFETAYDELGDRAAKLLVECTDKFLVLAFILATSHFLYGQLGVDRNEGALTKKRIKEIVRRIKDTAYDGEF